jgi:hypothetical protein
MDRTLLFAVDMVSMKYCIMFMDLQPIPFWLLKTRHTPNQGMGRYLAIGGYGRGPVDAGDHHNVDLQGFLILQDAQCG